MTTALRSAARSAPAHLALAIALLSGASPTIARAAEVQGVAPSPPDAEPERPLAAAPMTAEARARYDEGLRLYGDHDFTAAIREFEAGFALEPRREFLFGEAQAYRLAGDCARAVPLYERFLGSGPSALQVEATRLALDRCARRPAPIAARPAAPVVQAPAPPAAPPVVERAPWWHDRWALGSFGAGLVATGVGLGFVIASRSAADQANGPGTTHYADYTRLWNTAERRQTIGVAALAAGGALLAVGAFRVVWIRRAMARSKREDSERTDRSAAAATRSPAGSLTALVAPAPGGATVMGALDF